MLMLLEALRRRLTFANVLSALALATALSGTAYAASVLPANSVGPEQLRARAVTGAKLAPGAVTGAKIASGAIDTDQIGTGAVTLNRLSDGVQRRVLRAAAPGPAGPAGPAGPGAARLRYAADADGGPARTVVDIPAFRMTARCDVGADGTGIDLSIAPRDDVTITETVSVDGGQDITQGGQQAFSGNLAIALPGGQDTRLGGPSTQTGFVRAVATLVMPFPAETVTAQVAIVVDATAGRCTVDGAAVTAT